MYLVPKNVIIGVIYRKPNSNLRYFNEKISHFLDQMQQENNLVYLLGDYNINLINSDTHDLTAEFTDILYSNEFLPLISRPTRITPDSATLIDNIFTNNHDDMNNSLNGLLVTDISDHFPIFHVNRSLSVEEIDSSFVTRVFNERNKQAYLDAISETDWSEICNVHDTQKSFDLFHSKLITFYNKYFPEVRINKKYSNRKPWLSEALRSSIRNKNKLYHKYKKIPSLKNEVTYKRYRNRLNHLLKIAEKKYYRELIVSHKDNMRKSWAIMKNIINKHKKPMNQTKFKMNDGSVTDDKRVISGVFNDFFINIGPSLAKSIPKAKKSHMAYMGDRLLESIYLKQVTNDEICKIILSLKNSATGWDDISAQLLKLSVQFIGQSITHICNLSLTEGIFPHQLKVANVIPLYKADDPMCFNHYSPVSLLCILSKVFEKIMYPRLLEFLEKFEIIYKNQFGFRKKHSSYMALMVLMDEISKSLERGEYVVGVFLDFSKAFDTVNHDILLQKLYHYGIRGMALKWFQSYLSDRYQYVTYNGTESAKQNIKCGVPQGSILEPLLFLIYINDLANVCEYMMPLLFTDDTNLFRGGKNIDDIHNEISHDLDSISEWLKSNKLSLNIKKTHFIVFTRNGTTKPHVNLCIDGHNIGEVTSTKFLGVIIDNRLNWKEHIIYISGKISKGIGIILKARKHLDKDALKTLYYSFVYPYLCYCNHVWGNTYKTYLNKLVILQKKIIRIIAGVKPRTHTEPLFKALNILNVFDINKYLIGRFMFHIYNGNALKAFKIMFTQNKSIHNHDTRQSAHYHLPLVHKDVTKRSSIRYRGVVIWNEIMKCSIKTHESENTFLNDLKNMLLCNVLNCDWHVVLNLS